MSASELDPVDEKFAPLAQAINMRPPPLKDPAIWEAFDNCRA